MYLNSDKIIRKYQVGGSIFQPIPTMPVQSAPGIPATSGPDNGGRKKDEDEEEGPLSKTIMNKLLGEGLVNETMAFSETINKAYNTYMRMSDFEKNTAFGQELRRTMKGDIGVVTALLRNKANYENGLEKVKAAGAFSDFAITANGVIVQDLESGKIGEIALETLSEKGPEKYKMLTNAELAREREYNPNLINDTNSLASLNLAAGTKSIKNEIVEILSSLGKTESSKSLSGYKLSQGAEQLLGAGLEGFYKISEVAKDSNNLQQLKLAQEAMWNHLQANSKMVLRARAVSYGAKGADIENMAKELAVQVLNVNATRSTTEERDIDYDNQMTERVTGKKGDSPEYAPQGDWETMTNTSGAPVEVQINTGEGNRLTLYGNTTGALKDTSNGGTPYQKGTMYSDIKEFPQFAIGANASIGGNKITDLNALMYNGEEVATVLAPVKGDDTPDLEMAEKLNPVIEGVNKLKSQGAPRATIAQYVQQYGLTLDANGNPTAPNLRTFVVFNGSIHADALKGKVNKNLLHQLTGVEEDLYKTRYQYGNDTGEGEVKKSADGVFNGLLSMFSAPDVYRGQVYIELKPTAGGYARSTDKNDVLMSKDKAVNGYQFTNGGRGFGQQNQQATGPKYGYKNE